MKASNTAITAAFFLARSAGDNPKGVVGGGAWSFRLTIIPVWLLPETSALPYTLSVLLLKDPDPGNYKMKISTHKTLWWCLLAVCVGGMSIFAIYCIDEGLPPSREWKIYLWTMASLALSGIAILRLRFWYRQEPFAGPGLWQLHIGDLLSVSMFTGFSFALWKFKAPEEYFLTVGISASLLTGLAFVCGLLTATRRGLSKALAKNIFAASYVLRLFGALSVGGLISLLVFLHSYDKYPFELLGLILDFSNAWFGPVWLLYVFRAGLISLLLGLLGCHYAGKAENK